MTLPTRSTASHDRDPNTLVLPGPGLLLGDYEILEEIARGGMGVVLKAKQKSLNRIVALKMILSGAWATALERERFRNEAEAVAVLDHPNIVPIYDVGEHEGRPFFTMKLIEGGPLATSFSREPLASAGVALARGSRLNDVARMMATVARAVHHAHQRGILHRDLKPGNILLDADGQPHVTDFGLAKQVAGGQTLPHGNLTRSGAIVGTPSYMAPEQARGERGVSTAADVYSLGAILYECLTGKPPFEDESPVKTILQVLEREPIPPRVSQPEVDRDLETITLKCLQKEPHQRYASAQDLADDLDRWRSGLPIHARRVGSVERFVKWAKRRPAIAALTLLVFAVAGLGFGSAFAQFRQAQEARQLAGERADREEAAKDQARQALARAENDLYFASLTLAEREWDDGNLTRYRQSLDQCPEGLRDWEWHHLNGRLRRELLTLPSQQIAYGRVAYHPDGDRLAAVYSEGTVRVWDGWTGKPLATLPGHGDYVGGLTWSPDGSRVIVGGADRFARVWTLGDKPEAVALGPHQAAVFACAHHPTKPLLACGIGDLYNPSRAGAIVVWDLTTAKVVQTLTAHTAAVYTLAFHPSGSLLLSGSDDMTAILWDTATWTKRHTIEGHRSNLEASRNLGRVLRVRDAKGKEVVLHQHNTAVFAVGFSPDGKQFVTGSGDGTVRIWESATAKEVHVMRGHQESVSCVSFSPSGRLVVSGGQDRSVRLWSVATGREIRRIQGHYADVSGVAFRHPRRPDGIPPRMATASGDGTVKVWDPDQPQDGYLWRDPVGSVFGLAFAPDSRTLAAATGDLFNPLKAGDIRIFDVNERKQLFSLPGHKSGISSLAYSPDGKLLASGGADGIVKLWDLNNRRELRQMRVAKGMVFGVAFSPDGESLAASNASVIFPTQVGEAKVWRVSDGQEKGVFRGHQAGVSCLAYSPDGRYLATGSADKTVKVWDVTTGNLVKTLKGHPNLLLALAWSPDSQRIAASGGELLKPMEPGETRLWDVESETELVTLKGHAQLVNGAVFVGDGTRLATGSRDGTVKLWDTKTGRLVLSLCASATYICSTATSRDGRWVASGNWGGTVNLWEGRRAEPAAP